MNELITLGRSMAEAYEFKEKTGVGNVGFNKDGSLYHKDTGKTIIDKRGRLIRAKERNEKGITTKRMLALGGGLAAGALGGSLYARRRQAAKLRKLNYKDIGRETLEGGRK